MRRDVLIKKLALLYSLFLLLTDLQKTLTIVRSTYMKARNTSRRSKGEYYQLIQEIREDDNGDFHEYFRMEQGTFDYLLGLLREDLEKKPTHRVPITPEERLAITLRFLATGDSQSHVAKSFRIGRSTANAIFRETLPIIWTVLSPIYVPEPTTSTWLKNAEDFKNRWQFPHCVGAIDGKHVIIKAPKNSGTLYYNYFYQFSINLMTIVDARYRFVAVSVGGLGEHSDGGIFSAWDWGQKILNGTAGFPADAPLVPGGPQVPYVAVADEAFPLSRHLIRPFPGSSGKSKRYKLDKEQRIYNYRLSRARRIVENAFGIMVARWRILAKIIDAKPETVDDIVLACVALHNFMRSQDVSPEQAAAYMPAGSVDQETVDGTSVQGSWRATVQASDKSRRQLSLSHTTHGQTVRETFKDYFNSDAGKVSWQEERALSGFYQN